MTEKTFDDLRRVIGREGVVKFNGFLGLDLAWLQAENPDPEQFARAQAENRAFLPFVDDLEVIDHHPQSRFSSGNTIGKTFRFGDRYFRYEFTASSFDRMRWVASVREFREVTPVQKVVTVFEDLGMVG